MSNLVNPLPPLNLKYDASDNVLANINAQNINPNATSLNPYVPTLLSSQTGLSVTATAANTLYNIGTAISVSRNGIAKISVSGHVSGNVGSITLNLTRGGVVYAYGVMAYSLFSNINNIPAVGFSTLVATPLYALSSESTAGYYPNKYSLELNVKSSDSLQFLAGNTVAASITYIDDLEVMLQ